MNTDTEISTYRLHGRVAVLTINSPPVNALGHAVRAALRDGLDRAAADTSEALVIQCGGRTFFAGADITEFGKPPKAPRLTEVLAAIESSKKPVIAALHGTALGGGFELSLTCHYRIAVRSAKVGLPEVNLGLLPGAGGTQRVPRLTGIAEALNIIVFGKPMSAEAAEKSGLITAMVEDGNLEDGAIAFAEKLLDSGAPLRLVRDLPTDLDAAAAQKAAASFKARNPKLFRGFKAPANIVKAITAAAQLPFDEGIAREKELFEELVTSRESAAQRYIFFAERAAAKIPGIGKEVKAQPIAKVAVIGAGTMGTGIAIAFLEAGFKVTLIDRDEAALERGAARVTSTIKAAVEKGRTRPEAAQMRIAALNTTPQIAAAADADLFIEAVFEKRELKKAIFSELGALARPDAILATNTSYLDVNEIADAATHPERVVGMHFFSPANIMRLLEVVRGAKTSPATLVTAMELGRKLGKISVCSGVCNGFIANRMMSVRGNGARQLILEGATPWGVDKVMTDYGFAMGHFAMLDLVGLDVIGWDRENSKSSTVQEILCERKRWGQKTGGGYYDYDEKRRPSPSAETEKLIREFAASRNVAQQSRSDGELLRYLLFPTINEGVRILEEGIALRASDIDIALVTGYNWPVYTGGPMFWAETIGLGVIRDWLKKNGHTPAALLGRLAQENKGFADA